MSGICAFVRGVRDHKQVARGNKGLCYMMEKGRVSEGTCLRWGCGAGWGGGALGDGALRAEEEPMRCGKGIKASTHSPTLLIFCDYV